MGFFWTNTLQTAVAAGRMTSGTVDVKLALLARAPALPRPDHDGLAEYADVTTMADLLSRPGWEEVKVPGYARGTNPGCTFTAIGSNTYLTLHDVATQFLMTQDSQVEALALVVDGTALGFPLVSSKLTGKAVGIAYGAVCQVSNLTTTIPQVAEGMGVGFDATCTTSAVAGNEYVIFATDTPFRQQTKVMFQYGDAVSVKDDVMAGIKWYCGWTINTGILTAAEGPIALLVGGPRFEAARLQHVWMFPQRVNYAANPSFEYTNGFWQSSQGALARVANTQTYPSPYVGSVTGHAATSVVPQYEPNDRLYVETAAFYPRDRIFTFQVMAKGTGIARVAVTSYNREYTARDADWGDESDLFFQEWQLDPNTFTRLQGIRGMGDQGYEAALLIEVRGILTNPNNFATYQAPSITIDVCVVEEGTLLDWEYFDGDSTYAAEGDYFWYGTKTADKQGKSYSIWYNNLRDINGRLFGRFVDDDTLYTSADEQLDSMLSHWVPAGVSLVPHWGALSTEDSFLPPVDRSATPLAIELWPEQTQYFSIFEVVESLPTGMTIKVIGEGAHPISRAYVVSDGVTIYAGTVQPRPWEAPGLRQYEIEAMKAELFDLSIAQTVVITWPPVPAFNDNTLYIERGDPKSPQSVLIYQLLSAAGADWGVASGDAFDAFRVNVSTTPATIVATGAAFNAGVSYGALAVPTDSFGTGYPVSPSIKTSTDTPIAVGVAGDGLIQYGVLPVAEAAAATGTGLDARGQADTQVSTVNATGVAGGAGTNITGFPVTTGIASGSAFNPTCVTNSAPGTVTGLGISYYQSGNQWNARASWALPGDGDLNRVWVRWYVGGALAVDWTNVYGVTNTYHDVNAGSGSTVLVQVITEDTAGQQSGLVQSSGPSTYSPLAIGTPSWQQLGLDRYRVSWDMPLPSNGVSYYNVNIPGVSNTNETNGYKDVVVAPGTGMTATITPMDTAGRWGIARSASVTTSTSGPGTPAVSSWSYSVVNIAWGAAPVTDGYAVERWDSVNGWLAIGSTAGTSASVPVWQDTNFAIRVRAYGTSNSIYSGELHVAIGHAAYDTTSPWSGQTAYFAIYRNQTALVYAPGGATTTGAGIAVSVPGGFGLQSGTRFIRYVVNDTVTSQVPTNKPNPWNEDPHPWSTVVTGGNGLIIDGTGWTTSTGNPHLEGVIRIDATVTVNNPAVGNSYW